ncbi:hypothetical protein ACLOJK_021220 [Asimina triloba]
MVSLMKILFPMEVKVAVDLAQVDTTAPLMITSSSTIIPGNQSVPVDLDTIPIEVKEEHVIRMRALLKTVELGKRFFPHCSAVLDKIIDDDEIVELANLDHETPERQELRRQRFSEIQYRMIQAFNEDKEESDRSPISSACQ